MAEQERFRVVIRAAGSIDKPQRQTVVLKDDTWLIEWSTSSSVSMSIDFFNITFGRVLKTGEDQKKVEEVWRITRIPGHERKIKYGGRLPEATSTDPKPLSEGVYVVKISAMSSITVDLDVETGVGIALIKLTPGGTTTAEKTAGPKKSTADASAPVVITNETVVHLLDLLDSEDTPPSS